jgi:hypothetical protein
VEAYEGVVILASNMSKNIDQAFLRRLNYSIDFPFPDEDHRLRIWKGIYPAETPLSPELDFPFLARKFKITGGNIKNVAVASGPIPPSTPTTFSERFGVGPRLAGAPGIRVGAPGFVFVIRIAPSPRARCPAPARG